MTKHALTTRDLKRRDLLVRLAGVSVAALGLTYLSEWTTEGLENGHAKSGKLFPRLAQDRARISLITIQSPQTRFSLQRTNSGWVLPESDFYPVSETALGRLIKALMDLRRVRPLPAAAGLAHPIDPRAGGDGLQLVLEIDDKTRRVDLVLSQRGGLFLGQVGDDQTIYQLSAPQWPDLASPRAWLDLAIFDIPPERIATVELAQGDQAPVDIVRRPDGGFSPVGGTANPAATDVALLLTRLAFQNVMAGQKFTGPKAFTHTTILKSGLKIMLDGYVQAGRFWVQVRIDASGAASPDEGEALAQQTQSWAYEIPSGQWALLTTPPALLLQAPRAPDAAQGPAASD